MTSELCALRLALPRWSAVFAAAALAAPALADIPPDYDFQWVTIGSPNNPAYPGDPDFGTNAGRGSVSYAYRMPRLETTTGQWMEFINTFATRGYNMSAAVPLWWGAKSSGSGFSLRNGIATPELVPVQGINWRWSAMFCNWLNNGKSTDYNSILSGAYDTSTFSTGSGGVFTDQPSHSPGAKFWIPSLDEWLKAAHYDPNKGGLNQGGWWEYSNRSNVASVPGSPGVGTTSAGWRTGSFAEWDYPLGAYGPSMSAYGLLDLSGGASEWLEGVSGVNPTSRKLEGAWAGSGIEALDFDRAGVTDALDPEYRGHAGLRIVSAIPTPGPVGLATVFLLRVLSTRRGR